MEFILNCLMIVLVVLFLLIVIIDKIEKKEREKRSLIKKQQQELFEIRNEIRLLPVVKEISQLTRQCIELIEVMDDNDKITFTRSFLGEIKSIVECTKLSKAIEEDDNEELIKNLLNHNIKLYTNIVRNKHSQSKNYLEALEELKRQYAA